MSSVCVSIYCLFHEIWPPYGPELTTWTRLASDSQRSSCFCLLGAGIKMCHSTWLTNEISEAVFRVLHVTSKCCVYGRREQPNSRKWKSTSVSSPDVTLGEVSGRICRMAVDFSYCSFASGFHSGRMLQPTTVEGCSLWSKYLAL